MTTRKGEESEQHAAERTAALAKRADELERDGQERENTDKTLRAASLYARSLIEASLDPMVTISPEGRITDVNKATEQVTGVARENLIESDFSDYFTEPEKARQGYRQVLSEGLVRDYPLTIRHTSGRTTDVLYNATLYRNEAGEVQGIFAAARDITERKLAEQKLKSLNETLAQRAEQLRKLGAEVTQAEHRERRRLAGILHDHLQQLLVGARLTIEPLQKLSYDPEIRGASRRALEILDQALSESRSLTMELSPPVLQSGKLAPALKWLGDWMLQQHGLTVKLHADENITTSGGDVALVLFGAVRELLFNIVKHAQVKKASVRLIRLDAQHICVVISDDGVGFVPEMAGAEGGSPGGFGLFNIRERLTLLGGHLEVDSAPGRGSRITLIAPTAQELMPGEALPAASQPQKTAVHHEAPEGDGNKRKIRVLLVDDHAVLRQGLLHLLREESDMEVIGEAGDGRTAVELARSLQPEVVVMDVAMPELNGIEATRLITAELPWIRVIGLSMHEEADVAEQMRLAGAAAYLTKDRATNTLISAIRIIAGTAQRPIHEEGNFV